MYSEEFIENGIVEKVENGVAVIRLNETGNCEECSAKLICKPNNENSRIITAVDLQGVKPGYTVSISIPGKSLSIASIFIYGIPLILLMLGIIIGMLIFKNSRELWSSLLGISLTAAYYLFIKSFSITKINNLLPPAKIISYTSE